MKKKIDAPSSSPAEDRVPRRALAALAATGFLAGAAAGLGGCSNETVLSADEYLRGAQESMRSEDYVLAIQQYEKLLEEYPFSDHTEEAQLEIAKAYYHERRYAEAVAAFQDFQRMYPTSPNIPFAEYHVAMSFKEQMGRIDRDQQAAKNAHDHFQSLILRHPEHFLVAKAREQLQETRVALAEHELMIGRFYQHWENAPGAEARLRHLLETYPDTPVAAEALFDYGEYFAGRGDLGRAALAYAALVERYPEAEQAAAARERLADLETDDAVRASERPLETLLATLGAGGPSGGKGIARERPAAEDEPEPDSSDAV